MPKKVMIGAIILFSLIAEKVECQKNKQLTDDLVAVNVTKTSYPKKDLILQDFMDVEYIVLEANDDFVNEGLVMAVGKNMIIVKNRNSDGDIFIYDRKTGKALKKINRKGESGEEYIRISGVVLDEDNGEIFVNSYSQKKIFVYDLDGNFKRNFDHKDEARYSEVFHFDRGNLICYDGRYSRKVNEPSFSIISKQDGSITKDIFIPFKEKIFTSVRKTTDEKTGEYIAQFPSSDIPLIPYLDSWILFEASSDTIYRCFHDQSIIPFLVRNPPVQSMNPEIFLFPQTLTSRYYFMEIVKKEWNWEINNGFPSTYLMYDKHEKAIFKYTVYNGDFTEKREVYMNIMPLNHEIANWLPLEPFRLIADYKKGLLKGKLKEIAATLDEDDNPVIMLIKHKK